MKRSISEGLVQAIPSTNNAKTFFISIGERYVVFGKVEASQLMEKFVNMRYDGTGGVREYFLKMVTIATRLSELQCLVADTFLVNHALNSLPSHFDALKTSYNTQKENWDINTLISICAQEEERMKREISENVNLVNQPRPNNPFQKRNFKPHGKSGPERKFSHNHHGPKPMIFVGFVRK